MAISSICARCGCEHTLRDELAGKRYRCKECGDPNLAPAPPPPRPASRSAAAPARRSSPAPTPAPARPAPAATPPPPRRKSRSAPEVDDWSDALQDQGEAIEAPKEKRPPRKTKREPAAEKPSRSSNPGATAGGAVLSGIVLLCLVLKLTVKIFPTLPAQVFNTFRTGTPSWRTWTHPSGGIQAEMPAAPQSMSQMGNTLYLGEVPNRFGCGVMIGNLPPNTIGIPAETLADEMVRNVHLFTPAGSLVRSQRRIQVQGYPGAEIRGRSGEVETVMQMVIKPPQVIILNFLFSDTEPAAERERFFNSVRILGP